MLTHGSSQATTAGRISYHIATVAHMGTRACMIRFYVIGAKNFLIFFDNKGSRRELHPDMLGFLLGDISVISVGITGRCDLLKNRPDRREISIQGLPNYH